MKVLITDRNPDGRGRGTLDGRTALVSQAHPGEEILLHVDRQTRGTVQGRVHKLLRGNADRLAHLCQHAFRCTGCPMLAESLAKEHAFKFSKVETAVVQASESTALIEPLLTPSGAFGYRHYAKQVFAQRDGGIVLGSYVTGTHALVDNAHCPVLVPALQHLLYTLAAEVGRLGLSKFHDGDKSRGLRYAIVRHSASAGQSLVLATTQEMHEELVELSKCLVAVLPDLIGVHRHQHRCKQCAFGGETTRVFLGRVCWKKR
ncbi:MAG: hypothetical protein R3C68_04475 [Myxococcota bacterium]